LGDRQRYFTIVVKPEPNFVTVSDRGYRRRREFAKTVDDIHAVVKAAGVKLLVDAGNDADPRPCIEQTSF